MTKQEARSFYIDKRKKLSPAECAQLNLKLYHLFFSWFDVSFINILHVFLPLEKNNEPDTWPIIDRIRREFPHVKISVPRVRADGNLDNFFFEGIHQLQMNSWGIQEPKQGIPTPSEKIDVVIVPLLAFDNTGQRVGYGKGYYDRFLRNCRKDCRKIGLSFFDSAGIIEDSNADDIKLDNCIIPSRIITF